LIFFSGKRRGREQMFRNGLIGEDAFRELANS
jgi:hypothetical protein